MVEVQDPKVRRVLAGERVVCSDEDMDALESGLPDGVVDRLASVPNPNRVGTRDAYVAFATARGRCRVSTLRCPECLEPARPCPPIPPKGWAIGVEPERLRHSHLDGEPLCPVMTTRGYQPALPEAAAHRHQTIRVQATRGGQASVCLCGAQRAWGRNAAGVYRAVGKWLTPVDRAPAFADTVARASVPADGFARCESCGKVEPFDGGMGSHDVGSTFTESCGPCGEATTHVVIDNPSDE